MIHIANLKSHEIDTVKSICNGYLKISESQSTLNLYPFVNGLSLSLLQKIVNTSSLVHCSSLAKLETLAFAFISGKLLIKSITKGKIYIHKLLIEIFSNLNLLIQYSIFNNTLLKIIQKKTLFLRIVASKFLLHIINYHISFIKTILTTCIDKRNSFCIWYHLDNVTILYNNKHDINNSLLFSQSIMIGFRHEPNIIRNTLSCIRV